MQGKMKKCLQNISFVLVAFLVMGIVACVSTVLDVSHHTIRFMNTGELIPLFARILSAICPILIGIGLLISKDSVTKIGLIGLISGHLLNAFILIVLPTIRNSHYYSMGYSLGGDYSIGGSGYWIVIVLYSLRYILLAGVCLFFLLKLKYREEKNGSTKWITVVFLMLFTSLPDLLLVAEEASDSFASAFGMIVQIFVSGNFLLPYYAIGIDPLRRSFGVQGKKPLRLIIFVLILVLIACFIRYKPFSGCSFSGNTEMCHHPGCNNPVAPGDTVYCTKHSNRCLNCGKYIDEDATFCMDCIEKALGKH